ncbi:uncharacterized protein LOC122082214 [Macadamia integrifolia]|uniref:uncharacterized protein LOC122082214 n=1 Tax=Macadamia integrifolia TaxID=60698 RepID=UPI001C4E77BF|nr:uncharacterized protein LOC122082214 [Macadamia integrifolia]
MICSVPSAKSDSSWLDRLRSSKGFSVGNDLDLERFLDHNSDHPLSVDVNVSDVIRGNNTDSPNPNFDSAPLDKKSVSEGRKKEVNFGFRGHRKKEDLFNVMSNVLAELFNMGDQGDLERIRGYEKKKSSRKQRYPKICSFSASASVDDGRLPGVVKADGMPAMSPSGTDNNSETEMTQNGGCMKPKEKGKCDSLTLVEEKSQTDLSSYSCVEVTIIDTSCSVWKSEKLLFRKRDVWKVREKKSISGNLNVFRRKREAKESRKKVGGMKKTKLFKSDKKGGGKKKRKLSQTPLSTSKEAGREELTYPSNKVRVPIAIVS